VVGDLIKDELAGKEDLLPLEILHGIPGEGGIEVL